MGREPLEFEECQLENLEMILLTKLDSILPHWIHFEQSQLQLHRCREREKELDVVEVLARCWNVDWPRNEIEKRDTHATSCCWHKHEDLQQQTHHK